MDAHAIIKYPLSTEKAIRMMEAENKLVFAVDDKATKAVIKQAMEELFKVKVIKVNTQVSGKHRKKAYITLSPDTSAMNVATKLGML